MFLSASSRPCLCKMAAIYTSNTRSNARGWVRHVHYRNVFGGLLAEIRESEAAAALGCADPERVLSGARPMTIGELVMGARAVGIDWKPLLARFSESADLGQSASH